MSIPTHSNIQARLLKSGLYFIQCTLDLVTLFFFFAITVTKLHKVSEGAFNYYVRVFMGLFEPPIYEFSDIFSTQYKEKLTFSEQPIHS